ncbi:hypothetical protein Dimus_013310 [Dionaea muscipula]
MLHSLSDAERVFADDMLSKKIARIDPEKMRSRAKARIVGKGQEKSAPASSETVASAPKAKVVLDEGVISLKFPEKASVYADPSSLMESFEGLLVHRNLQRYGELGTAEVVDLSIQQNNEEKEVDRLKSELSEKDSENKQLTKEMKDMAMNAVIKVLGTLMKEFRYEQTSKWDVEGDIKLWEEHLALSSPHVETVD